MKNANKIMSYRMSKAILIALSTALMVSGCGTRLTARGECKYRGHPKGSPNYQACIEQVKQEGIAAANQSTQDMLAIGALFGAAYLSAKGSSAQSYTPQQTGRSYYLKKQWYDSKGHFCQYSNDSIINYGSQSCPSSIQ